MGQDVGTLAAPAARGPAAGDEAPGWPGGVQNYTFSVTDSWTGQTPCSSTSQGSIWAPCSTELDAYPQAVNCRASYVPAQQTQFDQDWSGASQTISAWQVLQTNPLPSGPSA